MELHGPAPAAAAGGFPEAETTAGLTAAQLAKRAQTTPEQVARLVRLGILAPAHGEPGYTAADVRRVRLADACEQTGLPLPAAAVGEAVRAGRLSFAFMNVLAWTVVEATDATYRELCTERGLPLELLQRLYEAAGLGRPRPDDPIRSQDRDILALFGFALRLGIDRGVLVRTAWVYGQNLRRITQAEDRLHHDDVESPLLAPGMNEGQIGEAVTQLSSQLTPLVERMLLALYQRHREHALIQHSVEHIEAALDAAGLGHPRLASPPADSGRPAADMLSAVALSGRRCLRSRPAAPPAPASPSSAFGCAKPGSAARWPPTTTEPTTTQSESII